MPYTDLVKKRENEKQRLLRLKERRVTDPEYAAIERARSKKWYDTKYAKDPEYKVLKNKRRVVSRYGLTLDQYNKLLEKQDYRCAICGVEHKEEKGKQLVIDHNHSTAVTDIRGLLCNACNLGLGIFKDNVSVLEKAAKYLEQYNER